ncbi:MAG TPA: creatininase family protein [Thermoprotei archaeon]|nr:creatininase family protein [Thermoprotei archaeon]
MKKYDLSQMTYEEARNYFKEKDLAILPIGSVEQHGKQNPLGTDYLIAYRLALEAAKKTEIITLPPIPFGISSHHRHFPGTIYISEAHFKDYVRDVCLSLKRHGVRKILVINGHGGNLCSLMSLARELKREGLLVIIFSGGLYLS